MGLHVVCKATKTLPATMLEVHAAENCLPLVMNQPASIVSKSGSLSSLFIMRSTLRPS